MIGLLRLVGLLNAALWLGAVVFLTFSAEPTAGSPAMQQLLSARNFPYFSESIRELLAARFFHWYLGCSIVALLHLFAEWLYLGKYPHRLRLGLLAGLCLGGLLQVYLVQPRLKDTHRLQYTRPDLREAADRGFRAWHGVGTVLQCALAGGLAIYLWQVGNPPSPTRFVSATKFRS